MKKTVLILILLTFLCMPTILHATTIHYDIQNLGGNSWEYTYSVTNDPSSLFNIDEFTIWYTYGLYSNLMVTSSVPDWSELVVQPDSLLGDGFYDALALVSGIAPGDTVAGFSVSFDWSGTETPGSQFFEVVDPCTFEPLDSGYTRPTQTSPVPEPGTLMLLSAGLTGIAFLRKRLKNSI